MRQNAISLPKKRPMDGQAGELRFGTASDAIEAYHVRTAGKILLISDGEDLALLAPFSTSPRALSVVLTDGDALPLFTMPDGVGGVIAAGGRDVLCAARLFAQVHRLRPLLLPSDGALDGACEPHGRVTVDGEEQDLPLASGEIVCDLARMGRSLARAYARLLLVRLSAFEAKVLSRFGLAAYPHLWEEAVLAAAGAGDGESVVRANAKLRLLGARGLPRGEGETLAAMYPLDGEIAAYRALCALYKTFFELGKPRKYFCPDYHARAQTAGISYASLRIPTKEEYAARAAALERMRKPCLDELTSIMRGDRAHMRNFRALCGDPPARIPSAQLKKLPEMCPVGLTAVIRDFGLMEF